METLKGKTVIITGGAGFIGSHIARRILKEGARVHLFLRPESATVRLNDILPDVTVHALDLREEEKVRKTLDLIAPNGIFHLAAVNQYFGHIPTLDDLIETNVRATLKFMDIAKDHPLDFFVNTGTFAEVGSKESAIRENDLLEPKERYGLSRVPASLFSQVLGREEGKPFLTVRVFTPYGPYVQKGKILYEAITRALSGELLRLTAPAVTRDYIYIDDLVELYVAASLGADRHRGHIFNGGSGVGISLETVAQTVLKWTSSTSPVVWGSQTAPYDNARWEADVTKTKELLGWKPRVAFEDGVKKTIEWFREHQDYWR